MKHDVVLGVSFCGNADLVRPLLESIGRSHIDGIGRKFCCLFVVDSPNDSDLLSELDRAAAVLNEKLPTTIIINDQNLGFVRSVNRIFDFAVAHQQDVILVNANVILYPETLREMISVAESDPMIGFVNPRSNSDSICRFPISADEHEVLEAEAAYSAFKALSGRLSRVTYVPTAAGFCLFVKLKMLQDFGDFDLLFGAGCNEESDLIAQANRYGYRVAIANWAFAFHEAQRLSTPPQHAAEKTHAAITQAGYGHWYPAASRYLKSPTHRALQLISCLRPGSPMSIAFDLSSFWARENGTTEYGTRLLASFAKLFGSKYKIHAICEPAAWRYHRLDKIDGLKRLAVASEDRFAAVVRLGQPFDPRAVGLGPSRGAVTIVSMLDCIAYDCLHLCAPELEGLWRFVLQFSDAVVYISEFSKQQFANRFACAEQGRHVVSMPSTDIDEYAPPQIPVTSRSEYLLIVGNSYAHKAVRETAEIVRRALPLERLAVLGLKLRGFSDIQSFSSGTLPAPVVQDFFSRAKAVIFPSHYEGFGFPILHAMGNKKDIFVRDLPVYAEIKQRVSAPQNIHVFDTNAELVRLLIPKNFRWDNDRRDVGDVGWSRSARELEAVLAEALELATLEKIENRLRQLDLLVGNFGDTKATMAQLEAQIHGFQTSTSWRLTALLRKLKMLFS